MKTRDLWSFLLDQETSLAKSYPRWIECIAPGDVADEFCNLALATERSVDEAIREFVRTGQWPHMVARVGAMLRVRLSVAMDHWQVLKFASRRMGFRRGRNRTRARLLVSTLIDLWAEVGFAEMMGTLEDLRRGGDPCRLSRGYGAN